MPFAEYVLLAILGSTGAAAPGGTPSSPSIRTLGADAIVQPTGGSGLFAQDTGGDKTKLIKSESGKKSKVMARRHHKPRRRHHKVSAASGKKATRQ